MTFSKTVLVLSVLVLAACSTESQKKKDIYINADRDYQQEGNFQVSTFAVTKSNITNFNKHSFPYRKVFNFKACIVDQLNAAIGQPGLKFVVRDEVGNEEVVFTDRGGCVYWTESPTLSYLTKETYFKIRRILRSENYYKGQVIMEGAFNPWANDGSALLDTRYNKLPEGAEMMTLTPQMQGMRNAHFRSGESGLRVNLKSASFKFTGLDYSKYEVTPLLGLTIAHKYQVKLSPTVIRQTLDKTTVPETLNTGTMKAVLVILKEDPNPHTQYSLANVVTSVEFEDDLLYGDIMANISITFPSVVDLMSRTVALITLVPGEELEGLPHMSFSGPLSPGLLSSLELKPTDQTALQLHGLFQAKLRNERAKATNALKLFEQYSGYKKLDFSPVSIQSPDLFRVRPEYYDLTGAINKFLTTGLGSKFSQPYRQLTLALCEKIYGTHRDLMPYKSNCKMTPEAYLEFGKKSFVESLNSYRPIPTGLPTVDTLRMATSFSTSDSESTSLGYSLKASLPFATDLLGIKLSIGGDFSYGRVIKQDSSTSTSVTRDRSITAEGNSFKLDVNVRHCFVAQPVKRVAATIRNGQPAGVYHCLSETKPEMRVESYYLVTSKTGVDGSPFTDNASANSTPWRMMIRGPQMKNMFADLINKPFTKIVLGKMKEEETLKDFKELYMTQEFPGLLSDVTE